jgi:superfamily II DNA or RNA helicase
MITRDERQDLAIDNWKKAGGRGTVTAATGFG